LPEINAVNDAIDILLSENLSDKLISEKKNKFIEEFKVISYELFSNCIIHNESPDISYDLIFNACDVELSIYSKGKGFSLRPVYNNQDNLVYNAPFPDSFVNEVLTVYKGIDSNVDCCILSNNRIQFQVTKLEKASFEIATLPEHFGLYIIASLTDNFEYSRSENDIDNYKIIKKIK
jgi:hypothetical protein